MHKAPLSRLALTSAIAAMLPGLMKGINLDVGARDFAPGPRARRSWRMYANKYAPRPTRAGSTHNPAQINALADKWESARIAREAYVFKAERHPQSITSIKRATGKPRHLIRQERAEAGAAT